jgi:hypothetical protein
MHAQKLSIRRLVTNCGAGTLAVIFMALLIACSKQETLMTLTHPEGLKLRIPAQLQVQQLRSGFHISSLASKVSRIPQALEVTVARSGVPEGHWPERRISNGREVRFRMDELAGGSGGTEYVLTAWVRYDPGHVLVKQTTQAEWPVKPDFSLAWTVLDGLVPPAP